MLEAIVDEEEQFRRAHLRLDIDGDAVARVLSADVHLVVRGVRIIFSPRVDYAALQNPVAFQWHSESSLITTVLVTRATVGKLYSFFGRPPSPRNTYPTSTFSESWPGRQVGRSLCRPPRGR